MDLHLQGKSVLVTGGSAGIGLACALSMAAEGCDVHLVSRSAERLAEAGADIQKRTGRQAGTHQADVAIERERNALAPLLETTDILVNCAGAIPGGSLEQIDLERWKQSWELKVYGYIELTRQALKVMEARGSGVIVNVIGAAGASPRYDYVCGSAANAALMAFTKAVGGHASKIPASSNAAPSPRDARVRVLGVNPGPTSTQRLVFLQEEKARTQLGDPKRWQELLTGLPFGGPSTPEEIADLVTFLASDRASYLNGTVIEVDGGAAYA